MKNSEKSRLSRRAMLAGLGVAGACAGAGAYAALNREFSDSEGRAEGSWWTPSRLALESAGLAEWTRRIGVEFEVATDAGSVTYKLTQVQPLRSIGERPPEVTRSGAFNLVFQGDGSGGIAGDRIYSVTHPGGALDMYFSRTDPQDPNLLAALFN